MIVFIYDNTFDGLLSCVFFAYLKKKIPDQIISAVDAMPLFIDEKYTIVTEKDHSDRVWKALEKKMSKYARNMVMSVWLSELPGTEMLLFRYICKNIDHPRGIEMNFGDEDVLQVKKIAQKVARDAHYLIQFVRFMESADGIWFAPVEPVYDILTLVARHFKNRYANQPWIIFDICRNKGIYYDLRTIEEVTFSPADLAKLKKRTLAGEKLSGDEAFFQQMWKTYFRHITIKERINPQSQRQHMPKRYWKYLPEIDWEE